MRNVINPYHIAYGLSEFANYFNPNLIILKYIQFSIFKTLQIFKITYTTIYIANILSIKSCVPKGHLVKANVYSTSNLWKTGSAFTGYFLRTSSV